MIILDPKDRIPDNELIVEYVFRTGGKLTQQHESDVGFDIYSNASETLTIQPGQRKLVDTGVYLVLPPSLEAQVRPKSSLALKHGITVLNSPGTIDPQYTGEVKVLLINHGDKPFEVKRGMAIAQLVFAYFEKPKFRKINEIKDTERGGRAFGYNKEGKLVLMDPLG